MLLQASSSLLLVIDIQSKLAPHIDQAEQVIAATDWLIGVARELGVPVRATEQYPQGLGSTVPEIAAWLKPEEIWQKIHFSACREVPIAQQLAALQRPQIVLAGTEAHVCCLQTAAGLLASGYAVFLVEEALGSRRDSDKQAALARLQQAGAQRVTREMVAFEWLEQADSAIFRKVSRQWIK